MPEYGRYEKLPRPESIDKFIDYLRSNKRIISSVTQEGEQLVSINRLQKPPLLVFMTNIYIVGLADVLEILTQNDNLGTIVTMSEWNGYTSEAKNYCREQRIGLFKFKEFLGAIYFDGDQYLNYISPEEREQKRRLGRRN